ncbi:MAG: glycosyltransferase family 9 protein [Nitrospirae bacterium]|nr:glycosyltransferase family 9 protein [Nitrospirota bacterium]
MNKIFMKIILLYYVLTSPLREKRESGYKKFLIIDTLRLGDVVMSTPVFKAIKKQYPDSLLHVLVRAEIADLLDREPYIDKIIPYHGKEKTGSDLIKLLQHGEYDISINLCEGKLNALIYAAGIPVRIGYSQRHKYRDRIFLTNIIQQPETFQGIPLLFLKLLEPLGISKANSRPELYPDPMGIEQFKTLLQNGQRLKIVVHPGARNATHRWPYYQAVIREIIKRFDAMVVVTGDRSEAMLADNILSGLDTRNIINLVGKTTIKEMAALCSIADLVLSNDTGVSHIACALGRPTITIFGPEPPMLCGELMKNEKRIFVEVPCRNDNIFFGLEFKDARRCKKENCDSLICMKKITPDMVLKKIQELLKK